MPDWRSGASGRFYMAETCLDLDIADLGQTDPDPPVAPPRQAQLATTSESVASCHSGSNRFQYRAALVRRYSVPIGLDHILLPSAALRPCHLRRGSAPPNRPSCNRQK